MRGVVDLATVSPRGLARRGPTALFDCFYITRSEPALMITSACGGVSQESIAAVGSGCLKPLITQRCPSAGKMQPEMPGPSRVYTHVE